MAWVKRGLLAGLVVLALIPLALLVMTAMHIRPVYTWIAGNNERIITVYVPVNHTVVKYVNQTVVKYVYVNQTVPVYINRTVYVPVYVNPLDTGTCDIYTLVLPNGTMWTIGYWIPTQQAWDTIMNNGTAFTWHTYNERYGQLLWNVSSTYIMVLGERGMSYFTFFPNLLLPSTPQPNWVNIITFGDLGGQGGITLSPPAARFVNDSVVFPPTTFSNWSPYLPLNKTSTVLIITQSYYILLCNWTVIGPVNPQVALRLPAPMGVVLSRENWYVLYGNYDYPVWWITWGFWVWYTKVSPINASNLPWPLQ